MNPYADALAAIDAAKLSAKMHVVATRLLTRVHPDNGYMTMSWDEVMTLFNVKGKGSVWKYLGRLKAAGLIHYSTNEQVDITFETWRTRRQRIVDAPPADSPRATSGAWARQSERLENDENHATIHQRRVDCPPAARGRAKNDTPIGIGLVGIKTSTSNDDLDLKTNQPKPVLTEEQQRSRELLTDQEIGLSDAVAQRLSGEHKFDWLLRQVFAWRDDIAAGRVDSAGALVNRIDRNYAPGNLSQKDRASPLYQRHVSEEEQAAIVASKYVPSEYADVINS